jgi:coenzyme Q-binding protein COQ10
MPTHAERKLLPYTAEQLFDLVADIERYPEFLPWCVGARIRQRDGNTIVSDLLIGYKMVRERFTSRVILDRARRIDVSYSEGPFKYLTNHWLFVPQESGCLIDFYVDFEFRSRLLQKVIELLFNEAVKRMVGAFETRAHALYGKPGAA